MERAKRLSELKKLIERSKEKHYVRRWTIKNGMPILKSETEADLDMTINFIGCPKGEDRENYKKFDLEKIANEQRKEVGRGKHEQ